MSWKAKEFSSPIGESIFSTDWKNVFEKPLQCSRPLSGNLFSLLVFKLVVICNGEEVLVPYRGIYFLYKERTSRKSIDKKFSSPIGESIFSTVLDRSRNVDLIKVLVPYRGIYFLYGNSAKIGSSGDSFSSPIGESIFSTWLSRMQSSGAFGSRPLSGNLFSLPF